MSATIQCHGYRIDFTDLNGALALLRSDRKVVLRQLISRREWRTLHDAPVNLFTFEPAARWLELRIDPPLQVPPDPDGTTDVQACFVDQSPVLNIYSGFAGQHGSFTVDVVLGGCIVPTSGKGDQ